VKTKLRISFRLSFSVLIVIVISSIAFLPPAFAQADCSNNTSTGKTPLPDLGSGTYMGFEGGLYPHGKSTRPEEHEAAGLQIAKNQVIPLDTAGNPDTQSGKIVMISVGMSNTNMMFAGSGGPGYRPVSFLSRIGQDPSVNPNLALVNGAQGNRTLKDWADRSSDTWMNLEQYLLESNLTRFQVQVAWVKLTEKGAGGEFPDRAVARQNQFEEVVRNLKYFYPNIKLAYFTTRTYAYVQNRGNSPEPVTYEDGFSIKWMIEKQIQGDPKLNYDSANGVVEAPWLSWGPYLWTDGLVPRSDGLVWSFDDQRGCGAHPSPSGVAKNVAQLLAFFKTDPTTIPWFLRNPIKGFQQGEISIHAEPAIGVAPLTVHFEANAVDLDGKILETVWTFDDGTFSYNQDADPVEPFSIQSTQKPVKAFYVPGSYDVHATITDDSGNTVTQTILIKVQGESTNGPDEPITATVESLREKTRSEPSATTEAKLLLTKEVELIRTLTPTASNSHVEDLRETNNSWLRFIWLIVKFLLISSLIWYWLKGRS
jgi:hypothetical protein